MDSMTTISLTKGQYAIVDKEVHDYISQWKWQANRNGKNWRARRNIICPKTRGRKKTITLLMHREILEYLGYDIQGKVVDHINRNSLDNRLENLRICSHQENVWNTGMYAHNTSGFKGVSYAKHIGKYIAYISVNGKMKYLGAFETPECASYAYNNAVVCYRLDESKNLIPL